MSISDLYTNEEHQHNLSHFANIVCLALADKNINHEEQKMLDGLSKKLGISTDEYLQIVNDPKGFPTHPPASEEERMRRLYNLTRLVYADHEVLGVEVQALKKMVISLGFPSALATKITEKAIYLVINKYSLADFSSALQTISAP